MKITVFTSNQPRHTALIKRLASVSDVTYAVIECNTVSPGLVEDFFKKSEVMQRYFARVMAAEGKLFGSLSFLPPNVRSLSVKGGDLNFLQREHLADALCSDIYVVFGASYIRGWLVEFLIERKALNIHMGVSPYYRGSSCNFWALYDQKPEYVGSTIHLLSKGLDSGPMLYHALPRFLDESPFDFSMRAVESAQRSLVDRISSKEIFSFTPQLQDRDAEIRYTRNADFSDEIAAEFLSRNVTNEMIATLLAKSVQPKLVHPYLA